jgi:RNA polymerase sigma factor (sigma-70 family)
MTRDPHLADDAFQAVFLVLVRRAADIRPRDTLRSWLYGVAVRVAREARRRAARVQAREMPMPLDFEPASPGTWQSDRETLRLLDEEIARLPEHLRSAVLLCELAGSPRRDAALRLQIAEGTLSSRLAKARRVLEQRLRARGVELGALGLASLLAAGAGAAEISPDLLRTAVGVAMSPAPPAAVGRLAAAVPTISTVSCKILLACTVAAVIVALPAASFLAAGSDPAEHASSESLENPAEQKAPHVASKGRIYFTQGLEALNFASVDSAGQQYREHQVPAEAPFSLVPSPDGRQVAYLDAPDEQGRSHLCLVSLGGPAVPKRAQLADAGVTFAQFCWSSDGKSLHLNTGTEGAKGLKHYRLDVGRMTFERSPIPDSHLVMGWFPGDRQLLTVEVGNTGESLEPSGLYRMNVDGLARERLTTPEVHPFYPVLSPDGTQVLCVDAGRLSVLTIGKPGSLRAVHGAPADIFEWNSFGWSLEGTRIVYREGKGLEEENGDTRLVTADPDGSNRRVIRAPQDTVLGTVFWR